MSGVFHVLSLEHSKPRVAKATQCKEVTKSITGAICGLAKPPQRTRITAITGYQRLAQRQSHLQLDGLLAD